MKLLRLGQMEYTVLAVYDDDGVCPVMESLENLATNNQAAGRMLQKLMDYIPEAGPNFRNSEKVKRLKDAGGIAEFREQPKRGPKVRVLFFLDGQKVVICTNAFEKRDKTPQSEIDTAKDAKERYFQAKERGQLEIEILENGDE